MRKDGRAADELRPVQLALEYVKYPEGSVLITLGGTRVYYAGDTDHIPEMSGLSAVDVALLPVGGTYTMNATQAAEACQAIGATMAVPYHWGDIVGTEADARAFVVATAGCDARLLRPGESISV